MLFIAHVYKCAMFYVFQSLGPVWLFVTPWTAAYQTSPPFTISLSLLKLVSNLCCNTKYFLTYIGTGSQKLGDTEVIRKSRWYLSSATFNSHFILVLITWKFPEFLWKLLAVSSIKWELWKLPQRMNEVCISYTGHLIYDNHCYHNYIHLN